MSKLFLILAPSVGAIHTNWQNTIFGKGSSGARNVVKGLTNIARLKNPARPFLAHTLYENEDMVFTEGPLEGKVVQEADSGTWGVENMVRFFKHQNCFVDVNIF